jgi:hypothetical protein
VTDGKLSWGSVACNLKVVALGFESGKVVVFDAVGTEQQRISDGADLSVSNAHA